MSQEELFYELGGLGAILAATAFVYSKSLQCGIVFDDHLAIETNQDVINPLHFTSLWLDDFWGRPMHAENSHTSYRPLTILTFKLQYYVDNGLSAYNLHLVNVLLHMLTSFMLYMIIRLQFGKSFNGPSALLAVAVFALHPVHVEAVTGLVGRAELLCAFFMLVTHFFVKVEKDNISFFANTMISLVALACAVASKEIGITMVGLVIGQRVLQYLVGKIDSFKLISSTIIYGAFLICYLLLRIWLINPGFHEAGVGFSDMTFKSLFNDTDHLKLGLDKSRLLRKVENPFLFHHPEDSILKVLSWMVIMDKYFELLVYPTWFSAEYSFNCVQMVENWSDERVPVLIVKLSVLVYGSLVFIIFTIYKLVSQISKRTLAESWDHLESLLICVAWFAVPFIPSSHLLVTVGTLVAERLLYIPSIGYSLVVGFLLERLQNSMPSSYLRIMFTGIMAFYCLYFAMATNATVPVWQTDYSLFHNAVQTCPNSAKMQMQLSQAYLNSAGNNATALKYAEHHLLLAKKIYPKWCDLDLKFGQVEILKGNINKAVDYYMKNINCLHTAGMAFESLQKIFTIQQQNEQLTGSVDAQFHLSYGELQIQFSANVSGSESNMELGMMHTVMGMYAVLGEDDAHLSADRLQHILGRCTIVRQFIQEPTERCELDVICARLGERLAWKARRVEMFDELVEVYQRLITDNPGCKDVKTGLIARAIYLQQLALKLISEDYINGDAKEIVERSYQLGMMLKNSTTSTGKVKIALNMSEIEEYEEQALNNFLLCVSAGKLVEDPAISLLAMKCETYLQNVAL